MSVDSTAAVRGDVAENAASDLVEKSFTIPSHLLHWVLKAASEFAEKDRSLPMIRLVHLEVRGNTLLAVATDRFVMGVAKATITGDADRLPDGFQLNVSIDELTPVIPLLKVAKRDEGKTVTVTVGRGALHLLRSDGIAARLVGADYEFPTWRYLMGSLRGSEPIGEISGFGANLDPEKLAKFTKVRREQRDRLTVEPNPESSNRPLTIRVGTDFIGILMPIRGERGSVEADGLASRAAWDALL